MTLIGHFISCVVQHWYAGDGQLPEAARTVVDIKHLWKAARVPVDGTAGPRGFPALFCCSLIPSHLQPSRSLGWPSEWLLQSWGERTVLQQNPGLYFPSLPTLTSLVRARKIDKNLASMPVQNPARYVMNLPTENILRYFLLQHIKLNSIDSFTEKDLILQLIKGK